MAKRDHHVIIDLTLSDDEDAAHGHAKVARIDESTGPSAGIVSAQSQEAHTRPQPATPFSLLKIREGDIPSAYNRDSMGADLNQLLQGPGLQFVMVCNYQVDLPWMLSAYPGLQRVGQLLVCHGERNRRLSALQEAVRQCQGRLTGGGTIQLHAPPLPDEYGTHHSKAFLGQFERGLRLIILTANMVQPDCTVKTQSVWWQDFPPKDPQSPPSSPLEQGLVDYFKHYKLPQTLESKVMSLLAAHDLSSCRAALVPSVPGWHQGPALHKYGHMRVRHLLKQEPLPGSAAAGGPPSPGWLHHSHLVCQCSSLGSLDDKWLTHEVNTSWSAAANVPLGAGLVKAANLHFIWPTVQEVRDSLEGWWAGDSIPGRQKNVEKPFLQRFMCRWGGEAGGRQRAMPHIKTYCRFQGQQLAWVMQGSHNLSKAAWGQLVKNGSTLKVLSYELSTLHLPSLEAACRAHRHCGFCCTPTLSPEAAPPRAGALGSRGATHQAAAAALSLSGGHSQAQQGAEVEFWTLHHMTKIVAAGSGAAGGGGGGGGSDNHSQRPGSDRVVKVPVPLPYVLPPHQYTVGLDKPWIVDVMHAGRDVYGRTMAEVFGAE